ncbi:MAG: type II toxin-antitoxin system VapC family toxin [Actinomycetota bacterium]|nr:type II toxin-antitoxin system VapC family toxin [Actinomycetota bacterium]
MPIVIDASVTMAWCFEDEASDQTDSVLDHLRDEAAVVPPLWQLGVANVMLVAERRRRITEAQAARFLGLLGKLPIRVDTSPTDPTAVVAAGRRHNLSAYAAAYLVLAERRPRHWPPWTLNSSRPARPRAYACSPRLEQHT